MRVAFATIGLAGLAATAGAQVSYTGGVYGQNFDTLPQDGWPAASLTGRGPHPLGPAFGVPGLDGWQGANFDGSANATEFKAHNGSLAGSAGRGILSLGADGDSDRALGALSTSNQINTFGVVLRNDTADLLDEMTIVYTGEQWRRGNVSSPNTLYFSYGFDSEIRDITPNNPLTPFPALNFVAPNTQGAPTEVPIDGNDPANQTFFNVTISGLSWLPGTTLVLQWTAEDITGQDDGLAIDNFRFSAAVPSPGAAALGLIGLALTRRRR